MCETRKLVEEIILFLINKWDGSDTDSYNLLSLNENFSADLRLIIWVLCEAWPHEEVWFIEER